MLKGDQLLLIALLTGFNCCSWRQLATATNADCIVQTADSNSEWNDYLISAADNYSITAICRCAVSKPIWQYYDEGASGLIKIHENSINTYCVDNGGACDPPDKNLITQPKSGLYIHAQLNNYFIEESTILLCGNTKPNYAEGIVIMISAATEACPITAAATTIYTVSSLTVFASSLSPTPSILIITSSASLTNSIPSLATSTSNNATPLSSDSTSSSTSTTTIAVVSVTTTTTSTSASLCSTPTTTTLMITPPVTTINALEQERDQYRTVTAALGTVVFVMAMAIVLLIISLIVTCKWKRAERNGLKN